MMGFRIDMASIPQWLADKPAEIGICQFCYALVPSAAMLNHEVALHPDHDGDD